MVKKAKNLIKPSTLKEAKSPPVSSSHLSIHWSFELFDNYSWHSSQYQLVSFDKVAEHMKSYEKQTWGTIENRRKYNHPIPISSITPEARKQLEKIKLDDIDELWRLRFDGKKRIWGIRDGRVFKVLWWDPEHTICPSEKKHT